MHTLALGKPNSAFYKSIGHILHYFGTVTFRHEHDFRVHGTLLQWVSDNNIDRVLMPNPYGNSVRLECYLSLRHAGIPVVASDRGALPNSWFFDTGFNNDSPSYLPEKWNHPLTEDERFAVQSYLTQLRTSALTLEDQGPRQASTALRKTLGLDSHPVLFVPLQRPKDTVVKYFSGPVRSMPAFLRTIELLATELERLGTPWNIVLKKHPLETDKLPVHHSRIRYASDLSHVHDLIETSDAVFTLNSGVGLLALCFGKPTGCLGEAYYAHSGLAASLTTSDQLVAFLQECIPPKSAQVERFIHHLVNHVYSFGTQKTALVKNSEGSHQRITHHIEFEKLRILGQEFRCTGDRVLVVSPVLPTGVNKGSQSRVSSVLLALITNGMRVSLSVLHSAPGEQTEQALVREIRQAFPQLEYVDVQLHPKLNTTRLGKICHYGAMTADLASLGTHQITNLSHCPVIFRSRVKELIAKIQPHFLLVNYAKLAPVVPRNFSGVSILETHDYQTHFLLEDQKRNNIRKHVNPQLYRYSEHRALRKFDRLIAINPDERKLFESLDHHPVFFLPAWAQEHVSQGSKAFQYDALFVGSISNFNVKGLLWFSRHVLPLILTEMPNFQFVVAGSIANAKELRSRPPAGVTLLGVVPDLAPLYEQTACVIAPLLGGAGMKIKVIEALSYNKAIVATPKALDGIRAKSGEHLLCSETPTEFANAVLSILQSESTRIRLQEGAQSLHRRDHSVQSAQNTLKTIFTR